MADIAPQRRHEAESIRSRRLELGWTQHRLAHESGISVATVRKLESDKQSYYRALTLVPLCMALGWRSDALNTLLPPGSIAEEVGDHGMTPDTEVQLDAVAAFDGELSELDPDELAELSEFVRKLRSRRRR
jgi:transcriptional regulator with XRE-family HTH domain